jgi:hypothetical protein
LEQCIVLWNDSDRIFCAAFKMATRVYQARLEREVSVPWNPQHCFTGVHIGIALKETAIFVHDSDFTKK